MSNIDLIKQRLAKLQSKSSGSFEKIDYSTIFWKPKLGKQVVRIVPRKANKDFPFIEVSFHQYNVFKKNVYSLENFNEKDPVQQLVKELYSENTDDSKDLAKKIRPKVEYYANVVVRGEEGLGVRLWKFNKTTYEKLLGIMADEDFGNIDDINEGTDLTVEGYNDSIKIGKRDVAYIAVNITPKRNISPLSTDAALVEKWLDGQKDILEIYKKYSYEEIKQMLKEYLNPSESLSDDDLPIAKVAAPAPAKKVAPPAAAADDSDDDSDLPWDVEEKTAKALAAKKPTAKVKEDKFNELFGED